VIVNQLNLKKPSCHQFKVLADYVQRSRSVILEVIYKQNWIIRIIEKSSELTIRRKTLGTNCVNRFAISIFFF
jgi:hypothetical protein